MLANNGIANAATGTRTGIGAEGTEENKEILRLQNQYKYREQELLDMLEVVMEVGAYIVTECALCLPVYVCVCDEC